MDTNTKPKKHTRYFIVLVLGGHAGDGYGVPFLHPVQVFCEDDLNEKLVAQMVQEAAANIPRVKHDQDNAVIAFYECKPPENMLMKFINDYDPYLADPTFLPRDCDDIKIRTMTSVNILQKRFKASGSEEDFKNLIRIKVSSDFSDEYPIQQACAARWLFEKTLPQKADSRGKTIEDLNDQEFLDYYRKFARLDFPKVDIVSLAKKVFTQAVKKFALTEVEEPESIKEIRRGIEVRDPQILADDDKLMAYRDFSLDYFRRLQMMMLYYRVFGKNNPLSIRYNKNKHQLTYPKQDGSSEIVFAPIPKVPFSIANDRLREIKYPPVVDGKEVFKDEKEKQ